MPKKKITVVNIDDNDNKNDEVVDVTETIQEPIEIPQELIEKMPLGQTVEEIPKDMETALVEETQINQIPETKTRQQELIKCPKCDKMVTKKTMKYTHKNTCIGEEQNKLKTEVKQEEKVVKVPKPEPVHDIEEVPTKQPKLVRPVKIMQAVITQDMVRDHRKQMIIDRINLRQDKMKNLFANSIK